MATFISCRFLPTTNFYWAQASVNKIQFLISQSPAFKPGNIVAVVDCRGSNLWGHKKPFQFTLQHEFLTDEEARDSAELEILRELL